MNVNKKIFDLIKIYSLFLIIDIVEIALNRAERRNALGKQLLAQVNKFQRKFYIEYKCLFSWMQQ